MYVKVSFNKKNFIVFLKICYTLLMLWTAKWIDFQLQNNDYIILEMDVEVGRTVLKCVLEYRFYNVNQGYS
jgi:hypothetical protein